MHIEVFDVTGRRVATLVDAHLHAGRHTAIWGASSLAPGVYFYRIQAGDSTVSRRAVIVG